MKQIDCILLVDDNPADNLYHSIIINESGVCKQIKIVTDGLEAIAYLEKSLSHENETEFPEPQLIFLDINMPRMNGFEFLESYIKMNHREKKSILISMLTTSINSDDKDKALTYNVVSEFQNKPITVPMLHSLVEKYF
ncbi:MAG: response regulator [Chitinophagaceae bacterium]|nr:MAG: response regulator [Chitinophagaceae bacterium]